MQGYNLEIRHIPGKRNPADSLSRQDRKDALGRKSVVVNANAELVQQIRIPENASDQEIQDILKQVFNAQEGNVHSDSVDAEILKQKIESLRKGRDVGGRRHTTRQPKQQNYRSQRMFAYLCQQTDRI